VLVTCGRLLDLAHVSDRYRAVDCCGAEAGALIDKERTTDSDAERLEAPSTSNISTTELRLAKTPYILRTKLGPKLAAGEYSVARDVARLCQRDSAAL